MHRERGSALLIVVGVLVLLFFFYFFRGERGLIDTFGFKHLLRLPCTITVSTPDENDKIAFPLYVRGFINGCGWEHEETVAGTVQVFDTKGTPVTGVEIMRIPPESRTQPYSFESTLKVLTPPQTGNGYLLFTSTTGLLRTVSIKF